MCCITCWFLKGSTCSGKHNLCRRGLVYFRIHFMGITAVIVPNIRDNPKWEIIQVIHTEIGNAFSSF